MLEDRSNDSHRIDAPRLRRFATSAFELAGMRSVDAVAAASVLVWASLRGVDTHGIRNLVPYYLRNLESGEINPKAELRLKSESQTVARFDGDRGSGLVTAGKAMRIAMGKAERRGVGIATVDNTHHLGPAGYFASLAIQEDMLGFCATGHFFGKGFHTGVAPIDGQLAMFSTNPISFAAPAGVLPAFVLDMSTACVTVNRIEAFAQNGEPIPPGWAKDADNQPTTKADAAKILFPLGGLPETGGHKGVALSMLVTILTGVLTGAWKRAAAADDVLYDQPTMGHFLAAIRIDEFMPIEQFKTSLDAMLSAITHCPPASTDVKTVDYPGSREARVFEERSREGIPIDNRLFDELQQVDSDHRLV